MLPPLLAGAIVAAAWMATGTDRAEPGPARRHPPLAAARPLNALLPAPVLTQRLSPSSSERTADRGL